MKIKIYNLINTLSKNTKISLIIIFDLSLICMTFSFSYFLYLNELYSFNLRNIFYILLLSIFSIPIFNFFGLYKSLIQYIEIEVVFDIFKAVTIYLIFVSLIVFFLNFENISKRVLFINYLIILISIIYSRLIAKKIIYGYLYQDKNIDSYQKTNVLIYGANNFGISIFNNIIKDQNINFLGFIDIEKSKIGRNINKYSIFDLNYLSDRFSSSEVDKIIISENASSIIINKIYKYITSKKIKIVMAPEVNNLLDYNYKINELKELSIEDILSRKIIKPIKELLDTNITQKSILISGAGGSIGFEICSIISRLNPKKIILVEKNEYNLYKINKYLNENISEKNIIVPVLCGVEDKKSFKSIFEMHSIDIFFHAAAYKHVDIVENNVFYAMKNNILGTINSINLSIEYNIKNFVLISSDKAVRPKNFMGASKRFSELILQYYANSENNETKTQFSAVRFGNVIRSSGSVIPLFEKQINEGGPLTVTDKKIQRYFMTINEAAELVIQSSSLKSNGDIFVLDMGNPVSIDDIAKKMITLKGYKLVSNKKNNDEIVIKYIGLRPGEKLYEELFFDNKAIKTIHPKIFKSDEKFKYKNKNFSKILENMIFDFETNNEEKIKNVLNNFVEDFNN